MIIYGCTPYLSRWAGERLGIADWGPCSTMGVLRHHEVVAAAVFNHFLWPNIEISFVTSDRRWATPEAVRAIMRYPFVQLKCKRLTCTTEDKNQRARAFLCRLGFRLEGVHPDALPTGDAMTYGLLRRDAERWLAEEREVVQTVIASAT